MKIIILGAGQVGESLAVALIREQHDIVMVDRDESRLVALQERVDLQTVCGPCSYPNVLRRAGADEADMLIAVTDSDEANMIACQVAYSLFNVPKKIARIRSPHYLVRRDLFDQAHLPIDVFISPEQIVTKYVRQLIQFPGALQVLDFSDGLVKLVALKVAPEAEWVGLSSFQLSGRLCSVVAVYRNEKLLTKEVLVQAGDELFFIAAVDHIPSLMKACGHAEKAYKRVFIGGGGNIGKCLALALDFDYQVKVIEKNNARCEQLAGQLEFGTVFNGEIADPALLLNENIEFADVFCAVTNDDEANIIACLQAKRMGVKRVMALINRSAYVDLIEAGSINIALSPQLLTVGSILKQLRQGDVVNVHALRHGAAEALEVVAHGDEATSRVVGKKVSDLRFPRGVQVAALVRDGEVLFDVADVLVCSGDHVILFVADSAVTREVERLFQVDAMFF